MCEQNRIMLRDIVSFENVDNFSIHFAQKNENGLEPLDVWLRDRDEFVGWQAHRPERDMYRGRDYIFALIRFYHETDAWLFSGVFEITGRYPHPQNYDVHLTEIMRPFIGRLKLRNGPGRQNRPIRATLLEYFDGFEVVEILREPYAG